MAGRGQRPSWPVVALGRHDATAATLLITLTGPDRPGVTSTLFGALAPYDVVVLDMEQVVVRGTLVLGVLLGGPRRPSRPSRPPARPPTRSA